MTDSKAVPCPLRVAVVPGDGIGPEVVEVARAVIAVAVAREGCRTTDLGGSATTAEVGAAIIEALGRADEAA